MATLDYILLFTYNKNTLIFIINNSYNKNSYIISISTIKLLVSNFHFKFLLLSYHKLSIIYIWTSPILNFCLI